MMIGLPYANLAEAKGYYIPVTVMILYQITVTDALDDERSLVTVGEYRILRIIFKRSPYIFCSCIGYHMSVFGASFGCHEVVEVSDFVYMGAF